MRLPSRDERRRVILGLKTVLGWRAQGFFIPYRYADRLAQTPAWRPESLAALFAAAEPRLRAMIDTIDAYRAPLLAIGGQPPAPRWQQDWFPGLDAAAAYAIIRTRRPARLIEIGSGHSTRFFVRAAADAGYRLQLTAIDPQPRADIAGLGIDIRRTTLQAASPEPFRRLAEGDVVSIDSSHVLMPGTDVDLFLNHILPVLPSGVLVHVHDIFLPDDYPLAWAWRGYNEQLGIATLLQGGGWEIIWSSHFVRRSLGDRLAASVAAELPLPAGALETSLWLTRVDR